MNRSNREPQPTRRSPDVPESPRVVQLREWKLAKERQRFRKAGGWRARMWTVSAWAVAGLAIVFAIAAWLFIGLRLAFGAWGALFAILAGIMAIRSLTVAKSLAILMLIVCACALATSVASLLAAS